MRHARINSQKRGNSSFKMNKKQNWCFPFQALLLVLVTNSVEGRLGLGSKLRFPIKSELACENYPILLRCPGTDVIEVVAAEYGRQNTDTCATSQEQMQNVHCYMPEAFGIMQDKCNNKTQCLVTVSDDYFKPDPCPGTHKYLQVTYNCVKYMFGCPGTLSGIGRNETLKSSIGPQAGAWYKDPIYHPNRVYFVPSSQQRVQEYESTKKFLDDDPLHEYQLPSQISGTSIVIYDSNVYYVKARSRRIVKYGLLARIRVREGSVPGYSSQPSRAQHGSMSGIELSADEQGLWVIYTSSHESDLIVLSKLNKETLTLEKTWKTTYKKSSAMHSFVICGVLYVVGYQSGNIDYMYNTNVDSRNGLFVTIGFDRNRAMSPSDPVGYHSGKAPSKRRFSPLAAGLLARGRSFRNYNFTSLKYNPRERLLYAWDASNGNAVYYMLHFRLPMPADANKPTTTTTTTTVSTTTRRRPPAAPHTPPPFMPSTVDPPNGNSGTYCAPLKRDGIFWPRTRAGDTTRVQCPDAVNGEASWRCEIDQFTNVARWSERGPDLSSCGSWISDLEQRLRSGQVSPNSAAEDLARELSDSNSGQLRGDEINSAARVMRKTSQLASESLSPLNSDQVQQLSKSITSSANSLLNPKNAKSWQKMAAVQKQESTNDILQSVETSGFLISKDLLANEESNSIGENGVTRSVEESEVFVQVRVHRATSASSQQNPAIVFPDPLGTNLLSSWSRITDRVVMPRQNLKAQASQGVSKLVFSVYNNLGQFADAPLERPAGDSTERWAINSRIISASLGAPGKRVSLDDPVQITLENTQESQGQRKCVYWSYSKIERQGRWSTNGCHVTSSNTTHTECSCDHLTSFAVLVNVAGVKVTSAGHELALDIITSVGICISLVCLAICMYTFTFFRNLQSDRNTIHKHLCLSLFVAELVFLVGIKQTAHPIPCAVIAGILHYTFLAAFMWMALEGFQLYVMLVEVFEERSRWKWYYFTGYGIPAVIVCVSAVVDRSGYGSENACWLKVDSGFIWSFVGPVCVVILCNLVFLGITVFKMYRHTIAYSDSSKINAIKASVRGASVLLCLLGITWAFGILWIWEQAPVMAYLFCIFNAFQGLCIFVFHCLLPKKVRTEYSRCFGRSSCCRKRGQESYVSNSMSFSKQYTPGRYSAPTTTHNTTLTTQSAGSHLQRMWTEAVVNGPRTSDSGVTHSQDLNTMPGREQVRNGKGQRHSATQQFPSSSSPQLRRASADRLLDAPQQSVLLSHALPECQEGQGHEDEVFLPPKSREFPGGEMVSEDAYEYDRLQRHCHEPCGRDCVQHYHSPDKECGHRHHTGVYPRQSNPPRPQPRSMTMNQIKAQPSGQFNDSEGQNRARRQQFQRSSTLAQQPGGHWDDRRAPSPSRRFSHPQHPDNPCLHPHQQQDRCHEGNCYGPRDSQPRPGHYRTYNDNVKPRATLEPLHSSRVGGNNRRRRSLNSSDSDDPIVNDFSASSSAGSSCGNPASLSRNVMTRSMIAENTIHENGDTQEQPVAQERHREPWTPLYRDENDLEVQRLTDSGDTANPDKIAQSKLGLVDSQRDSAFYQSMNELSGSPNNNNYSSPSSGCSTEMASGDDDTAYRPARSKRPADGESPRYVLSPPSGFKHSRSNTAGLHNKERVYEDMVIKSHPNDDPDDAFYNRDTQNDNRYTDHVPNQSLITAGRRFNDDDAEGRNSAGSSRMMTCL